MSIKEIWNKLLNKKWKTEDIIFLVFVIVIASIFTTPLIGIPLGIVGYILLFGLEDDES